MLGQFFFVIPCFLGIFLFAQRITQLTITQSIFFTVSLLGLINYIAVLFNAIYYVDLLIIILAFIWFVFEIIVYRREFAVAPLIVFIGMLIVLIFAVHGVYLHYWDEFSFWGKITKWIFLTNHLPDANTPINYKDYPPGAALFHYFIYRILGQYTEPNAFLAQGILLIAPVLAIASAVHGETKLTSLLRIFIILIASIAFYEYALFQKLYVDILLSCYFAGAISIIYLTENHLQKYLTILPVILFLTLIKQAGLFFAEFIMLMLVVDFIMQPNSTRISKKIFILYLIATATLLIILHESWVIHYQHLNVTKTFATNTMHFSTMIKDLIYTSDPTISTIKQTFFKAWIFPSKEITARVHTSVAILLIIYFFITILLMKWEKEPLIRKRYMILNLCLSTGLIAYSIGLLIFYMYSFSSVEAVRIASFGRYMHIYLIAYTLIMVGILNKYIRFSLEDNKLFMTALCVAFIFIVITGKPHEKMLIKRQEVMRTVQMLSQLKANSKVFVIYQNDKQDDGTFIHMLQYELLPINVNACASFGSEYHPGDYATCNSSVQELKNEIKEYEYILIAHTDELFWQKYGGLFAYQKTPQFLKRESIFH